jgi:ABC-type sugar transport system substrate-binding protein
MRPQASILPVFRLVSVLLLGLLFAGCEKKQPEQASPSAAQPAAGDKIVIAMLPKLINIDYFDACKRGATKAAEELGVTLIYDGPTEPSGAEQNKFIDTWIRQTGPVA